LEDVKEKNNLKLTIQVQNLEKLNEDAKQKINDDKTLLLQANEKLINEKNEKENLHKWKWDRLKIHYIY